MLTITWNTKRLYTREGQIMTAQFDFDTREVRFRDHSRMIDGLIRTPLPRYITSDASHYQLQDWVDTEYLHNRYDYDRSGVAGRLQRQDIEADHARRVCRVADALSRK